MENTKNKLAKTLADFKVKGQIVDVRPGKLVTVYYFEAEAGVKNSSVLSLSSDIARNLGVPSVFIAVKRGSHLFAIEVPNETRELVKFDDLIGSVQFVMSTASQNLPILLGYDSLGKVIVEDLTKMPQLLIAGTTGSGKSVLVNNIIMSILKSKTPEECQLVLIDPKLIELSVYNGIKHLSLPVIQKAEDALYVLNGLCDVMDDRYAKMAQAKVRSLESYNEAGHDKLPYIVTVIDEFADLMAEAGKGFEACVQRIAQMGRAAGIHLVIATQRPSVNVITGVIKANLPARISCKVSSKIDSMTILNRAGAEELLGAGDMFYLDKSNLLTRIQSPYLSDIEISKFLSTLEHVEMPTIAALRNNEADVAEAKIEGIAETNHLEAVIAFIQATGRWEYKYVSKKVKISQEEHDDIILQLEKMGIVSSEYYNKTREVLI